MVFGLAPYARAVRAVRMTVMLELFVKKGLSYVRKGVWGPSLNQVALSHCEEPGLNSMIGGLPQNRRPSPLNRLKTAQSQNWTTAFAVETDRDRFIPKNILLPSSQYTRTSIEMIVSLCCVFYSSAFLVNRSPIPSLVGR